MAIRVELTYDMSKVIGESAFELDGVETVADIVERTRRRFGDRGEEFARLARVARIAVNGVLVAHARGMKTRIEDGDRVGFVKAAAGG